ncbi:MAG TPA: sulfate adenylyltransferase subunit CysN [Acidobacteriaceae bacterium]|jgi:sulfate adenylyltransferase subunit 1|nr:sulfate adenylyltransferase subunit CysN [Acidobacteriaceae bacterium]
MALHRNVLALEERPPRPGPDPTDLHVEALLAAERDKDLLRFSTAGSVDDGKSTLIGRLLYDSNNIYDDHIASVTRDSAIDFAQLTDGLRAEREQGITIDVAYRYFSTPKRKFIIADTPGHEQYTRNMATGASTADVAIVLVDARKGILDQTRRHACIAALLGIPIVIAAINKMDLVGFSPQVFDRHRQDLLALASVLRIPRLIAVPVSALDGDNVVRRSSRTPWYEGPPLLELLETVPLAAETSHRSFRFPVQRVIRPGQDFRGYAGQIASGVVRPGDEVIALPSGVRTRVRSIATWDGDLPEAHAPQSVVLTLHDEVDISRGDLIADASAPPQEASRLAATVVWMHATPLRAGATFFLKHTTQIVRARVTEIRSRVDMERLESRAADSLPLNAIGDIVLETHRPVLADLYSEYRSTGSFILIDPADNTTSAAGMIRGFEPAARSARPGALIAVGNRPALARDLEDRLHQRGVLVVRTRFAHREALLPLVLAGAVVIGENTRDPAIALLGGDGEPLGEPVSQEADAILQQLDNAGTLSPGESV